jgi:hypothetical protein
MELEPEPHRVDSLRPAKAERSGFWWVGVIAVGILIGNIFSYGAYELYQRWQLKQFMVTVDAMLESNWGQSKISFPSQRPHSARVGRNKAQPIAPDGANG